jgi:Xaa-Pro aminopeptidase
MTELTTDEDVRAEQLLAAQDKAIELFDAVEARGIIAPGVTEVGASDAIRDLAADLFGIDKFWHKRIVRGGPNTLKPYRENPPDRVLGADDIAFADFGPIFDGWEADLGRTFVLGSDPVKQRIAADLPVIFEAGQAYFHAHDDVTGEQLYAYVVGLAEQAGWEFGGIHSGHLVGQFPHETIDDELVASYIKPGSDHVMRRADRNGQQCHWILEVHLVDRAREIGGFYEQLLDLSRT